MSILTIAPVLRKPAPPKETRVAPRPHVRMAYVAKDHVPLRRAKPVPVESEVEPEIARRVRGGHTYNIWDRCEYSYDAAEARSGLVGHPA